MSYQDELQRLEAENARLKDELIDVLKERNDLAAELAKCKPNWDDAPPLADGVYCNWRWYGEYMVPTPAMYYEEPRPRDKQ